MRSRRLLLVLTLLVATVLFATPSGGAAPVPSCDPGDPNAGALGVGDDYYPLYGNGGYDMQHVDLAFRYRPKTHAIRAVATIDATATQTLSCFSLDLVGLEVRDVTVDDETATFTRDDDELIVTPASLLGLNAAFTVRIAYGGVPTAFVDIWDLPGGFVPTNDGLLTFGEPESAALWFPVNDHPTDRASYTFNVTVPAGYRVVANGIREGVTTTGRWKTHVWQAQDPMPSYLVTVDIGDFDLRFGETASGLPIIDAVDPDLNGAADASLARQPEMIEFLESRFGPYPFEAAGAIAPASRKLLYALETQTRPIYAWYTWPDGDFTVLHELAHQWFGDLVALDRWQHMWLNEGFATYAEWLWDEHEGGPTPAETLQAVWDAIPRRSNFWNLVIGDPGVQALFNGPVYVRGAMTIQALRNAVGDTDFWTIVDEWIARNEFATGTTDEFIALAEEISGQDLSALFELWLFTPGRPPASAVAPGPDVVSVRPAVAAHTARWLRGIEARYPG